MEVLNAGVERLVNGGVADACGPAAAGGLGAHAVDVANAGVALVARFCDGPLETGTNNTNNKKRKKGQRRIRNNNEIPNHNYDRKE